MTADGLSDYYGDHFERCGATCRDGSPCQRPSLPAVGACEVHFDADGDGPEP